MGLDGEPRFAVHGPARLLLIRHVHTAMAGRFCGQIDPPIDAEGNEQLSGVKQRVSAYPLTAIYSSDLLRARQTAEAVSEVGQLVTQIVPELREISFGRWEGLCWDEIVQADSAYAERWMRDYPHLPAPGGEIFAAFQVRVRAAMRQIAQASGGCAAVVTHAGVIRTILLDATRSSEKDLGSIECGYGSFAEVVYEQGEWRLPE